ncbi:hypothetical protein [Mycolicibacterium gadium]|uniref:hypothetical protein n=1 Tax=Mycolicibacterium gadium TaxID=1794 RepID=UPI002FDE84AA
MQLHLQLGHAVGDGPRLQRGHPETAVSVPPAGNNGALGRYQPLFELVEFLRPGHGRTRTDEHLHLFFAGAGGGVGVLGMA